MGYERAKSVTVMDEGKSTLAETLKVCLVDDDPMIRTLFARVVSRSGCEVVVAGNAAEAEAVLAETKIDLVLSDLMMPDYSDGEGLLKKLISHYPSIPICMMSGNMAQDIQAQLMEIGASACLMKPFSSEMFCDVLNKLDVLNNRK